MKHQFKMSKISILGCGWLGLPLAKSLVKNGFEVNGSTTSPNKLSVLKEAGIQPFLISLEAEKTNGAIEEFLQNSTMLIIDIPPKLRGAIKENFVAKIQMLIPFIEQSSVENVLFISSTSVYSDSNQRVNENTLPNPDTESGIQLLASEKLIQSNTLFTTTILRFGGLIGQNRHPITSLAGRTEVENPQAVINMIHQDDCIGIILKIILNNSWGTVFNGVAPHHPSRVEYYTQRAIEMGLQPPTFDFKKPSIGKIIDSTKVIKELDYNFIRLDF